VWYLKGRENDRSGRRGPWMTDLLMIAGTVVFFLIAIAYTIACDKLK
jgi:hypothetical protein